MCAPGSAFRGKSGAGGAESCEAAEFEAPEWGPADRGRGARLGSLRIDFLEVRALTAHFSEMKDFCLHQGCFGQAEFRSDYRFAAPGSQTEKGFVLFRRIRADFDEHRPTLVNLPPPRFRPWASLANFRPSLVRGSPRLWPRFHLVSEVVELGTSWVSIDPEFD